MRIPDYHPVFSLENSSSLFSSEEKKDEDQGKEKCHTKSMMSTEVNESLKRDTQYVLLGQNTKETVREKGLKTVYDDVNE